MSHNDGSSSAIPPNNNDAKAAVRQQIPHSTQLRHYLSFYNPIVWWRVTVMRKRIVSWNTYDLVLLFLCGCPSPLSFWTARRTVASTTPLKELTLGTDRWNWWTIAIVAAKVPLYGYLWYKTSRTADGIRKSIREIQQSRMMAHPDAYQCLYDRMQDDCHANKVPRPQPQPRAYRTFAYDVYVPPPHAVTVSSEANDHPMLLEFILFLPGAFVEHVAYAQPAALLSDQGYVVVVMSSEPTGIVDMHLPQFYGSSIRRIQQEIERKHATINRAATTTNNHTNNNKQQCRWIFMGHSMGSLTCTKLVSYFPNVHEIVLWGSAPFLDYMGDLSQSHGLRVLVVQGKQDQIIQTYCTLEMIKGYWKRLPSSTTTLHEIVGGTHHGFGNYIRHQIENDASDIIPIKEQHAIAVEVTIDFLRKTSPKY